MKKVSFSLMVVMLAVVPAVFAQQEVNQTTTTTVTTPVTMTVPESMDPWQVSVQGGGLWAEKDKSTLHDGEAIFGRLTYDLSPNLAVGGESGGMRFENESNGIKYGHLDGVPAMADLVLKMPIAATDNRLVPYVFGGAGVIFWSYAKSGYSDTTGVSARSRTHFAAKPGLGLEYYVTPHVSLFIEGSYLFSRKFDISGVPNGRVDVDSIYGGGGLKIAF